MKVTDILEGKLQNGKYNIPYSWPNRSHRGLERMYNYVTLETAKALDVPGRNVRFSGHSAESGAIIVRITSRKTEEDMLMLMLQKVVRSLLEKAGFQDIKVDAPAVVVTKPTVKGTQFREVGVTFTTEYPEIWKQYDRERFGYKVA